MSKIIVVTGANRGIGLEIVKQLANSKKSSNYKIIGTFRSDGDFALKSLGANASKVSFQKLDVTNEKSIKTFAESFKDDEKIDTLVNNAGIMFKNTKLTTKIAKQVLGVNYYGLKHVTQALLPKLEKKGRIINITSGLGTIDSSYSKDKKKALLSTKNEKDIDNLVEDYITSVEDGNVEKNGWSSDNASYSASKAFANRYGVLLSQENPDLFVANVHPGWVRTRMGGNGASLDVKDATAALLWLIEDNLDKLDDVTSGQFWHGRRELPYAY